MAQGDDGGTGNERAKCAAKAKKRSGTRRRQARTNAADDGSQPVATIPSLLYTVVVTRRRRRVTSFAFPFGGRANGRVYRQCRQRPQRTRVPCTVRLRRRLLRALPLPAARAAGVRLPPAARSPESKRQCLRGRACGAKRREEERAWARGARARALRDWGRRTAEE